MLPEEYRPDVPPFAHQYEALEAGWSREGFAYLLEMGLGKSRVTIDNFCLLHRMGKVDALCVIAPKSVYSNWTREDDFNPGELQKWMWSSCREGMRVHTWRSGRRRQDSAAIVQIMDTQNPGVRVLAMNVEALASTRDAEEVLRHFLRAHRTLVVIDESTVIKNPKAVRTKIALRAAPLGAYRRILTGRISTGSPTDLFSQFEFLGPGQRLLGHRSWFTFRSRYCQLREISVGGRTIKMEVGTQNLDELARIVQQHGYRRRKVDCLDLPPKEYRRREIELTKEQELAYSELKKSAMTTIYGAEVTTQIVLTQITRMHQVLCGHVRTDDGRVMRLKSNRLDALLEIVDDTDEQVVVWCGYRPDAALVAENLKRLYGEDTVAEWHGGRTQAEREAGEVDFQAGRRRFMVATQSSGARGRTWTAGTLVVYYSNTHDLELREQSEDRTHRIGTTGTVTYVDLVVPKTLDETVLQSLFMKRSVVDRIMSDGITDWM